tara:strand:+ start:240 stop:380 length:141 start_codon:yes stop_codon:yes gene_type:complete
LKITFDLILKIHFKKPDYFPFAEKDKKYSFSTGEQEYGKKLRLLLY